MKDIQKEFKPTSWSIDNKTSIWVVTAILTIAGIMSYIKLPKEKFPDIVVPTMVVSTINFGTSPSDIENLITKPIEKQLKAVSGVKKVTSSSIQDFSIITVEFTTDINPVIAKQRAKDAVDKARIDLPQKLTKEPNVQEFDFSEQPIMYLNLSGDFDLSRLKEFADDMKDAIEGMKEIRRVDIVGALDREIQIDLNMYAMEAANITFYDVQNAVANENLTLSGGQIAMDGMKRTVSINGQFTDPRQIEDIVLRSMSGSTVKLKDIGKVSDSYHEKESYARLEGKNVVTLNIIKRAGENLINTSDQVRKIAKDFQDTKFPRDLKVTITGDQSSQTRVTLDDLINTIIIGFALVTLILMFFMGATNAIFVGLSVPLSCFLAFLVFPSMGFGLNMIVLFSFLLALGIVVDDAIVVIENTHRIFDNGNVPIKQAAKMAAGEVFLPVLSGTLTTLAPFIPLAFWPGIVGKFMFYLPVTLIVTLLASLVVAYIINPVFAVQFMRPHHVNPDADEKRKSRKRFRFTLILLSTLALICYAKFGVGMGNLLVFFLGLFLLHHYVLEKVIRKFQEKTWPAVQDAYASRMRKLLKGYRPIWLLVATIGLLIFSFILTGIRKPKVVFFPQGEPNFVNVFISLPYGTDVVYTDSITHVVEDKVFEVIGHHNPVVESVISNVAVGASDPADNDRTTSPHKGRVQVAFVEFAKRNGVSTSSILDSIRTRISGIPGCEITIDKERAGPPTGKPISIELIGDDLAQLIAVSKDMKNKLDSLNIKGVEELKSDLVDNKPQLVIDIDRERAMREGISTGQIAMEIRSAIFGSEVSKFRDVNDEYPIQVRFNTLSRTSIEKIMNHRITFRDMNMGGAIRQIPISSVAKVYYDETYGIIKRKNQKRIVTLSSNVLSNYNPNDVLKQVQDAVAAFPTPPEVTVHYGGEQEQQAETGSFLGSAMLISLGLIFLILVTQFNSVSKPIIILSEIIFSIIGVLLGLSIFNMSISIVMTGVGVVALAGIVVRNGILLVEFTDLLMEQGMPMFEAVLEAGRTRMTPVLLTASATILGLIPLAVGLNIDFVSLFETGNPHIFFGGDSVAFWGPLSWTMIFGLSFATFLTLVLVPAMYLLNGKLKARLSRLRSRLMD